MVIKEDKQGLENFRATARLILSPTLKNKFNSHDWLKIPEPRKVTAKAFNEIPEFCLVVVFNKILVNFLS